MTEIKIEKKKSIIPWILLILGILAAVWYLFIRNDETQTTENETTTENVVNNNSLEDVKENNAVVAEYVTFITSDTITMGIDHEYSSQAISKLANATEAMANEVNVDVKADVDEAKQLAAEITNDPLSTNHADKIKVAAGIISSALVTIQQSKYPNLSAEANEVKDIANNINGETLTLDQKDVVKSYFRKTSDLLDAMN
jgi:preprotein translocase subunit YajC